jgi:hypothetical protein
LRRDFPDLSAARRYQILQRIWPSAAAAAATPNADEGSDRHPREGSPILVFKMEWLDLILSQQKTLEIRHQPLKPGTYFLGCHSVIYGVARIADAECITTDERWEALRAQHMVSGDRMYRKTWALRLQDVTRLPMIPYEHRRGAIGIVAYRPPNPSGQLRKRPAAASVDARLDVSSASAPSDEQPSLQQSSGSGDIDTRAADGAACKQPRM